MNESDGNAQKRSHYSFNRADSGFWSCLFEFLEKTASGHWILIIDNADDVDLLFGRSRLADYFPQSLNGVILLTTGNKQMASKFTTRRNKIQVQALEDRDSINLLKTKVGDQFSEHEHFMLANTPNHVPPALIQATASIHECSCFEIV